MQPGPGHAAYVGLQHGYGHAAWTWTRSMYWDMLHGHVQAACTCP
jgi:hypothetical protein